METKFYCHGGGHDGEYKKPDPWEVIGAVQRLSSLAMTKEIPGVSEDEIFQFFKKATPAIISQMPSFK